MTTTPQAQRTEADGALGQTTAAGPPEAAAPRPTASQRPAPVYRRRPTRLIAILAGVLGAGVAGIAHVASSRSVPQPASIEEAAVGANSFGLSQLGGFQVPDSLSDRVLSIHLALYSELTSAADRHASVAGALRELLLVFAVAGALALFTLCRQLGLGTPTALGAVLLGYAAPAVVSAQVLLYPATVATTWLLVAAILIAARPTGGALTGLIGALGLGLIALAAVITPVALLLPAGVLVVAVATGTLFPRWGLGRRGLAVAAVLTVFAVAAATGMDAPNAPAVSPVPQPTLVALAVAGLVLAAVATWRVLWIRPLALGSAPLFVVALLPWDQGAWAMVIGVPIIAVLLAAVVEEALTSLRRPGVVAVRAGAAALVAAAALGLLVLPASATDSVEGAPQGELATWLAGNLAADTTVRVEPLLWVELVRAGVPADRLQRTDQPGTEPVLLAERGGDNADLPLVARFGAGPLRIDVRQRVNVAVVATAELAAEREASAQFGSALAGNPNLTLDDAASDDLGSGNVDSRLLTVLAAAAADFSLTIDAFPRTNGAADAGTLRTVRLSAITELGPAAAADDSNGIALRDFFRTQLKEYRPLSQGFDDGVLVVVYPAPSVVGLLS